MGAIAGVGLLIIMLIIGVEILIPTIIGFIVCNIYKKKNGKKCKLWIRILLWIIFIIGIIIVIIPLMYFYVIVSNW
ncbi:MAG: hypothetical protein Q4G05_00135 [Clostridia bacterium]|nr:hypothetical protein [Clostridia bacterium]